MVLLETQPMAFI